MKKIIVTLSLIMAVMVSTAQNLEVGIKAGISRDNIALEDVQNLSTKIEGNTTTNIGAYIRL
ncbi:MAG: hypothetical protein ACOVK9_06775, partial [Bacteroidia bacterium]